MIYWVWMQQPGLSWGWETDVGAAVPLQGQCRAVRRLRNGLSVPYVCLCVRRGWGGQTTCFSFPLISHLLCLDYHFGRRPVRRRCINICSQFARWPRSSMSLLCPDIVLFFFCVIPSSYHIRPPGELQGLKTKPSSSMNAYKKGNLEQDKCLFIACKTFTPALYPLNKTIITQSLKPHYKAFVLFLNFSICHYKRIIHLHTVKIIHSSLLCKTEIDVNG